MVRDGSININEPIGDQAGGGYLAFPGTLFINDSGIQLSAEKQANKPGGCVIVEGYKESFGSETEAEIVYLVPWPIRKRFVDWVIGSEYSAVDRSSGGYEYGGGFSRSGAQAKSTGVMSREIPCQHPEMPWLYATDCRLEECVTIAARRNDITIPTAGTAPGQWDNSLYTASNILDPDDDGNVQAAQAVVADLQGQINSLMTFPLSDVNQADLIQFLGLSIPISVSAAAEFARLTAQPNLAGVNDIAGTNSLAATYLSNLAILQAELAAAQQELANAYENVAPPATDSRRLVDMIRYMRPNPATGGAPFLDGYAKYRVTFRPRLYAVRTDAEVDYLDNGELNRNVVRQMVSSVKSFQVPIPADLTKQLIFTDAGFAPNGPNVPNAFVASQGPIQYLFLEEWTYIWEDVPDVPYLAWERVVNHINGEAFDAGLGFASVRFDGTLIQLHAKYTMLCMAPQRQQMPRNVRGRNRFRITYKFLKNPYGWNYFPDASGRFREATFGGQAVSSTDPGGGLPLIWNTLYQVATSTDTNSPYGFDSLFVPPLPVDYQTIGHG